MSRIPRRYAVHLHLSGGQSETVMFASLDAFQQWYGGVLTAGAVDTFVNVPISDLDGEYLVLRPSAVIAIRVEPRFNAIEDE
jgi:predicted DNA-binding protein with PD1-like motif